MTRITKQLSACIAFTLLATLKVTAADKPEPLKLAVIAPVMEWDDVPEIKRLSDWMEGHYNIKVTWIQPEHPPKTDDKQVKKTYYSSPPPVKDLEKAFEADVVYTAMTHVALNKADTLTFYKIMMTKPLLGGKRAHHGLNFRMDKNQELPDEMLAGLSEIKVEKPQTRWAMAAFGCVMGGHHGGKVNFAEGQSEHPIIKGLDELMKHRMTERGYKYKQMAPDVTVLIESEGMPQVWLRDKPPGPERRVVYVGYDPVDFDKHESLRRLMARAVCWLAGKDHKEYEDG